MSSEKKAEAINVFLLQRKHNGGKLLFKINYSQIYSTEKMCYINSPSVYVKSLTCYVKHFVPLTL